MIVHDLISTLDDPGPDYLFETSTGVVEFVVIAEDMRKLNDYCVICDHAALKQLSDWDELRSQPNLGDESLFYEDQYLGWEESQETVVAGVTLILLSAFVEKQLKWLCNRLNDAPFPAIRPKPGQAITDSFFDFLRKTIGLQFEEPPESQEIRTLTRRLRNQFAHGDWDDFRADLADVDLSRAFSAVTALFESIEDAYSQRSSQPGI